MNYLGFGACFVINKEGDTESMQRTSTNLKNLGISFERFSAIIPSLEVPRIPGPRGANNIGCTLSHRAVLQIALERKLEDVLIFEDDVIFRDDSLKYLVNLKRDLILLDWDMYFMGAEIHKAGEKVTPHLHKIELSYMAHAYAVQTRCIPKIFDFMDESLKTGLFSFDSFKIQSLRKFISVPTLAVQSTHFSAMTGCVQNRYNLILNPLEMPEFFWNCKNRHQLILPSKKFSNHFFRELRLIVILSLVIVMLFFRKNILHKYFRPVLYKLTRMMRHSAKYKV